MGLMVKGNPGCLMRPQPGCVQSDLACQGRESSAILSCRPWLQTCKRLPLVSTCWQIEETVFLCCLTGTPTLQTISLNLEKILVLTPNNAVTWFCGKPALSCPMALAMSRSVKGSANQEPIRQLWSTRSLKKSEWQNKPFGIGRENLFVFFTGKTHILNSAAQSTMLFLTNEAEKWTGFPTVWDSLPRNIVTRKKERNKHPYFFMLILCVRFFLFSLKFDIICLIQCVTWCLSLFPKQSCHLFGI